MDDIKHNDMGQQESDLSHAPSREDYLRRIQTAESVWLPRDVFEKLYLSPENKVSGDLRKTFGNPTPAALIGFVMSATPYACASMGWRGAGGQGGAIIPTMIFFGGMLQIIGATMEWVLGNTFPMCLFFTYGTFWIVAGTQLVPAFGTGIQYAPAAALTATGTSAFQANILGQTQAEYFATFGFYYLSLAMLTVIFAVCSLRTNIVFFSALTTLVFAFGCAAGAFWNLALGNVESGQKLTVAAGAFTFALTMMIWYVLLVQLLDAVDFPITLPVGDLSKIIKGKSEKAALKKKRDAGHSD